MRWEVARRFVGVAGGWPGGPVIVTAVVFEEECMPSVTSKRNASMAGPSGAVNVGVWEVWFDSDTIWSSS